MKCFKINDIELEYCRATFNDSWSNERTIEVPIGNYFLDKFGSSVFEVGAVMPYYERTYHKIIDLADDHPASIKKNALECDYSGLNVLSVSTIEHMHEGEYGNSSNNDSITFLNKVLNEAKNYLITFAIGYNLFLDNYMVKNPQIHRFIMKRLNWKNEWIKISDNNDFNHPFGHSDRPIPVGYFNNANGDCIVTNLQELL